MDFLGIGLPELIVILILAVIFIGPRDMPQMAARVAKFLRDLRMMSEGFTIEWQREINAATRLDGLRELKEELEETKRSMQSIGQELTEATDIKQTTNNAVKTVPPSTNSSSTSDESKQPEIEQTTIEPHTNSTQPETTSSPSTNSSAPPVEAPSTHDQ